jgi:hypothetical protein
MQYGSHGSAEQMMLPPPLPLPHTQLAAAVLHVVPTHVFAPAHAMFPVQLRQPLPVPTTSATTPAHD